MPDMTCQEFHAYFEDPLRVEADLRTDYAEVAAHIAKCADCSRLVEAQKELGENLRLVRESTPQLSPSLDRAVLANYRRHIAGLSRFIAASPVPRRHAVPALLWSAAAMIVIAILFLPDRKTVTTIAQPPTPKPPSVAQLPETNRERTIVAQRTRRLKPEVASARPRRSAASVVSPITPFPAGFRSLMYCDELCCLGAMEMIRVQLPSFAAGFKPASTAANDVVYADVLVGPDGIARGIRIVQ
jgi:hypothetical protein